MVVEGESGLMVKDSELVMVSVSDGEWVRVSVVVEGESSLMVN